MTAHRGAALSMTLQARGCAEAQANNKPSEAQQCAASFGGSFTSRRLVTRLGPEECRRRLEAHVLPTEQRLELQLKWRLPPADRELTGQVTANTFALRKTLPIYAYEPSLWGRFERTPSGTQIRTYFVPSGSRWVIVNPHVPLLHSFLSRLWLWLTLTVVAGASIVEGWRAGDHEQFLVRFLVDLLEAVEII